jgi:cysteine desulfurase
MDVYLDNHATTPCDPAVLDAMWPWFAERFGNPASRSHAWGYSARGAVEDARARIAARIGASPKEVLFTSGATEADNLALLGVLRANRAKGDHLVTVATEHKAVLDTAKQAEREGFRVTVLPVDAQGLVDPERFEAALTPGTVLASVMWANNEIGVLQPLHELGRRCAARGVLLHTDAAQALATEVIDLRELPVHLMSLSAHKAHGPKGIGALFVRRGRPRVAIEPLMFGGGHERGLRPGTLPVPLIVGFGVAAAHFDPVEVEAIRARRDRLQAALVALGGVTVNGAGAPRHPGNLHVSVEGVEAEALMLGCRDVAMSSGSACTSESLEPSHVLRAIGLDPRRAASSVRFGVGRMVTDAMIDHAIARLTAKIVELRSLSHLLEA